MPSGVTKILLTGLPGCGKTTAVRRIVASINSLRLSGFYTEEMREGDVRVGFRWKRLDGPEGTLAHVDKKERFSVGKYRVDVASFERCVVPTIDIRQTDAEMYVIDEVGKMECLSLQFADALRRLLISEKPFLATVAKKGTGLIAEVKNGPGVTVFTLTERNRDEVVEQIVKIFSNT